MTLKPGLYVTATPIGNLGDITYRAVEALRAADLILCEDTRHTGKLCAAYGISARRAPYHEHNAQRVRPGILRDLREGRAICLVSDAGTPLISDPGYRLVAEARAQGTPVYTLPGPCAAIAALSVSGSPSDRFLFAGFPPPRAAARREWFAALAGVAATLVFYESPQRLAASLAAMAEAFGPRRAVVARELTKLHEDTRDGALDELAAHFSDAGALGEMVVIVDPPAPRPVATRDEVDRFIADALKTLSVRDAAAVASGAFAMPKREAYQRAMALKAAGGTAPQTAKPVRNPER